MAGRDHITGAETLFDRGKALKQAPTRTEAVDPYAMDLDEGWDDDAVDAVERLEKDNRKPTTEREPEMG